MTVISNSSSLFLHFLYTEITNDFCTANIDCGFESNSICYNGTCICKLGFQWNGSIYKCQKKRCTKDDQCSKVFANTVCETKRKNCICPVRITKQFFYLFVLS